MIPVPVVLSITTIIINHKIAPCTRSKTQDRKSERAIPFSVPRERLNYHEQTLLFDSVLVACSIVGAFVVCCTGAFGFP